ncbi:hypothetical protein EUTSA_v10021243mg [Eutrema salsugineum]|uniref:Peptide transporter family protein n=1 Tax=Eutrema salsugineum TaxID=72664 RepID=V4LF86_EUTSA|nr:uncharacterized protein LOC18024547 [Eutrema salsugineum]ESQ49130.1 hypothetical protein EUTSA_v10021243mg [Eutrema salsugineum]
MASSPSRSLVSSYTFDDKDLDDADLWAILDSAAAAVSRTTTSSAVGKPLAVKFPNYNSPATPVSFPPPQSKRLQIPNQSSFNRRSHEESPRPNKMARSPVLSEVNSESPLALVTTANRNSTPIIHSTKFSSPESYLSPGIRHSTPFSEVKNDPVNEMRHSLSGSFPSATLFKEFQNTAMAILEKSDYTMISGKAYIKKSGWRKISFYFNVSYEIRDKTIEFDENRNVQRAEFIVRAIMHGGRFADGWGSCERREKKFLKPNHDIPSTAETRAKNRACQDLLGIGEYRQSPTEFPR